MTERDGLRPSEAFCARWKDRCSTSLAKGVPSIVETLQSLKTNQLETVAIENERTSTISSTKESDLLQNQLHPLSERPHISCYNIRLVLLLGRHEQLHQLLPALLAQP